MNDGYAARRIAAHAYDRAIRGKGPLDESLSSAPGFAELDVRDRGFARMLAATAVRRTGQTQAALDAYLARSLPDDAHAARALLQTGAAQMIWLDTPPHAAVSATVGLAKEMPGTVRYAGLINAVLRKISDGGAAIAKSVPASANLPGWLREGWQAQWGKARTEAIAEAVAHEPTLDLTLRAGEDAGAWAEALDAEILPGGSLRKTAIGDLTVLPGYETGAWWAQDAGAALPARLLGVQPGERVLDLCAAPGGKTLQLAAAGATVTALDASAKRLARLKANLKRTGLSADIVTANGRTWTSEIVFDAVLLDAPCTATGTLRRRPDAAWAKQAGDAASLSPIQDDLAATALAVLKPGGRLVICTCSLQPEEGEHWLARILDAHPGLRLDPVIPAEMPGLETAILPSGAVRLTPDMWAERGGIDGFFMARLIRPEG